MKGLVRVETRSGHVVRVNPDHVVSVNLDPDGSVVVLTDGQHLYLHGDVDEAAALLDASAVTANADLSVQLMALVAQHGLDDVLAALGLAHLGVDDCDGLASKYETCFFIREGAPAGTCWHAAEAVGASEAMAEARRLEGRVLHLEVWIEGQESGPQRVEVLASAWPMRLLKELGVDWPPAYTVFAWRGGTIEVYRSWAENGVESGAEVRVTLLRPKSVAEQAVEQFEPGPLD